MLGALGAKWGILGAFGAVVLVYWALVGAARDHRERTHKACAPTWTQGVRVVRVPARDVAYARRQGWPRVLRKGGNRVADVVAYDKGPVAGRVLDATGKFCHGQRYRLTARKD